MLFSNSFYRYKKSAHFKDSSCLKRALLTTAVLCCSSIVALPIFAAAPVVNILSPVDGSSISADDGPTVVTVSASDAEDGDLSASVQLSSNLQGNFTSPVTLTPGTHVISASVTDSDSETDTSNITLIVTAHVNALPTITLTAPADGTSVSEDDGAITFDATASDDEDGDLTGAIQFSSSLDGNFTSPASLSVGSHTITASVTDSDLASSDTSISLTVTAHINLAPSLSISAPADGSSFQEGESITFNASASDTEDGDLSSSVVFSSSLNGVFTSPASHLGPGSHTITANVTDSAGVSVSAVISITIIALDGDNDGMLDTWESANGLDPLDAADAALDADGDTLSNLTEFTLGTDPQSADTDGDGVNDNVDVFPLDPAESEDSDNDGIGNNADSDDDNDGMPDSWESGFAGLNPTIADGSADLDGDGFSNLAEYQAGTDPTNAASFIALPTYVPIIVDDITIFIPLPADTDGDGLSDEWEVAHGLHPGDSSDASADADSDGLSNLAEFLAGTDLHNPDSDGDGESDSTDIFPLDGSESADDDGDGVGNNADDFPNDAAETQDSDDDGVGDNADLFPFDATETTDADGDGIGDNADLDDDNDGMPDSWESDYGFDPTNAADASLDSDSDGFTNLHEFETGSDPTSDSSFIGLPTYVPIIVDDITIFIPLPADTDGDSLSDEWEVANGLHPGDASDATADGDGDGLNNLAEFALGTQPQNPDSDGDGVIDGDDLYPTNGAESADSDGDGVGDNADVFPDDPTETHDSDSDGVGDNADAFPFDASETLDSDEDGEGDNADLDDDNDGLPDTWEESYGLNTLLADANVDSDNDGFSNLHEYNTGTDPTEIASFIANPSYIPILVDDITVFIPIPADTDADGMPDEWEVQYSLHPGDSSDASGDADSDGLSNITEFTLGTNPQDDDSDGDFVNDSADLYPLDSSESADSDGDGVGDNADIFPDDPTETHDSDNDGVGDNADVFPDDSTETHDADADGIGDNADLDDDNDGMPDQYELDNGFNPADSADAAGDADGDGISNKQEYLDETDPNDASIYVPAPIYVPIMVGDITIIIPIAGDEDGDGVKDDVDAYPLDASEAYDSDGDGIGNNTDEDDDGDGLPDVWEESHGLDPLDASDLDEDLDGDGISNVNEFLGGTDPTDASSVPPAPEVTFTTSKASFRNGESATLSWRFTEGTVNSFSLSVAETEIEVSAGAISVVVKPTSTSLYTLNATGFGGSIEQTLELLVYEQTYDALWPSRVVGTGQPISTSVTVAEDGATYIGSFDKNFYKFSPNGELEWTMGNAGVVMRQSTLVDNAVIFASSGVGEIPGLICAMNTSQEADSVTDYWVFKTASAVVASPLVRKALITQPDNTQVERIYAYITTVAGMVHALDITGTIDGPAVEYSDEQVQALEVWRYDLGLTDGDAISVTSTLSANGNMLVVRTTQNRVYAINTEYMDPVTGNTVSVADRMLWWQELQQESQP